MGLRYAVACNDADCRAVDRNVAAIREAPERAPARTPQFHALMRMGERAVPGLRKELDSESDVTVATAATALIALGHGDEVLAWCETLERDDRGIACVR